MSKFKVGDEVIHPETGKVHKVKQVTSIGVCLDEKLPKGISKTIYAFDSIKRHIPTPPLQTVYAVCDEKGEVLYIGLDEDCIWESYCGNVTISPQDKGYSIRPYALTPINE